MGRDSSWVNTLAKLTTPKLLEISFDEQTQNIAGRLRGPACDWWVPDLEGLREIGIPLRKFDTPDRKEIAQRLNLPVDRIFWGKLSEWEPDGSAPCNLENAQLSLPPALNFKVTKESN